MGVVWVGFFWGEGGWFWGGGGFGVGVFCNEFFFMFFLLNKIMKISNNFF